MNDTIIPVLAIACIAWVACGVVLLRKVQQNRLGSADFLLVLFLLVGGFYALAMCAIHWWVSDGFLVKVLVACVSAGVVVYGYGMIGCYTRHAARQGQLTKREAFLWLAGFHLVSLLAPLGLIAIAGLFHDLTSRNEAESMAMFAVAFPGPFVFNAVTAASLILMLLASRVPNANATQKSEKG